MAMNAEQAATHDRLVAAMEAIDTSTRTTYPDALAEMQEARRAYLAARS